MTIPISPANINPQVHQTDGGAEQFLKMLLAGANFSQEQQKLQLRKEELKQRQKELKDKEQELLQQAEFDRQVGETTRQFLLSQMDQGQIQIPAMPTGTQFGQTLPATIQAPTGPAANAVRQLPAQAVPAFQPTAEKAIERQRAAKFRTAFLSSLPEGPVRSAQEAALNALEGGAGREQAADLASVLMRQVDPKTMQAILKEFPEFQGLPPDQVVDAFVQIRRQQVEARLGIGEEGRRQAQRQLDELRKQEARMRITILSSEKTPDAKTLQAVLAYNRIIEQALDPVNLGLLGLIGKSKDEQIKAIFGAQGLSAYNRVISYLQSRIPGTSPETP